MISDKRNSNCSCSWMKGRGAVWLSDFPTFSWHWNSLWRSYMLLRKQAYSLTHVIDVTVIKLCKRAKCHHYARNIDTIFCDICLCYKLLDFQCSRPITYWSSLLIFLVVYKLNVGLHQSWILFCLLSVHYRTLLVMPCVQKLSIELEKKTATGLMPLLMMSYPVSLSPRLTKIT